MNVDSPPETQVNFELSNETLATFFDCIKNCTNRGEQRKISTGNNSPENTEIVYHELREIDIVSFIKEQRHHIRASEDDMARTMKGVDSTAISWSTFRRVGIKDHKITGEPYYRPGRADGIEAAFKAIAVLKNTPLQNVVIEFFDFYERNNLKLRSIHHIEDKIKQAIKAIYSGQPQPDEITSQESNESTTSQSTLPPPFAIEDIPQKTFDLLLSNSQSVPAWASSLEESITSITKNNTAKDCSTQSALLAKLIDTPHYLDTPLTGTATDDGDHAKKLDDLSLSPLNHRDIAFQGRKEEMAKLDDFIADTTPFQMLYIVAPSGAGKTRLITEWHRNNPKIKHWQSGFVEKEKGLDKWEDWKNEPLGCDTLIIVDYIYRFKQVIQLITGKGVFHAQEHVDAETEQYRSDTLKLRLIILDHVMPHNSCYDDMDIHKRQATGRYTENYSHHHSPLFLGKAAPKKHEEMIKGIISQVSGYDVNGKQVTTAYETLQRMDAQGSKENDGEGIKFANYPLFAILMGKKLAALSEDGSVQSLTQWQRSDLMAFYFDDQNQRRIPWKNNKEFGVWVGASVSAATVLQSLPYQVVFGILNHPDIHASLNKTLLDDEKPLDRLPKSQEQKDSMRSTCNHIVSSMEEDTLLRYQPDILGETFTLHFVADFESDFEHHIGVAVPVFKMLCGKEQEKDRQLYICRGLIEFSMRTARNLSHDDQASPIVRQNWRMLSILLRPQHYDESQVVQLCVSIALTSIIKLVRTEFREKFDIFEEHLQILINSVDIDSLLDFYECDKTADTYKDLGNTLDKQACLDAILTYMDWQQYKSNLSKHLVSKLEKDLFAHGEGTLFLCHYNAPHLLNWITQSPNFDVNHKNSDGTTALMVAALAGHIEVVSQLLKIEGIDVNAKDQRGGAFALMLASQNGHIQVVEKLVKVNGVDINAVEVSGLTALIIASQYGHLEVVSELLRADEIEVNAKLKKCGSTALILASQNGHSEVVSQLLKFDAIDVNAKNIEGWTALALASYVGNVRIVEQLLRHNNINVNVKNNNGFTALMGACFHGHQSVVEKLLKADEIDVNVINKNGVTALTAGSVTGHEDVVEQLLKVGGIEVNTKVKGDNTALILASFKGYHAVVGKLLNADGIDVNIKNSAGWTALISACNEGHESIVLQLLNADGIDVNAKDRKGRTALIFACRNDYSEIALQLLKTKGIEINAREQESGFSALMVACQSGSQAVVLRLLKLNQLDINAKNNQNYSALMIASHWDNQAVVEHLLNIDTIDVNAVDERGWTSLTIASENGHSKVVSQLLKADGVDVNSADQIGCTALMYASKNGHVDVVSQLVRVQEIDVNSVNQRGFTALMYAAIEGHQTVVERLLKADGVDVNVKDQQGVTAIMRVSHRGLSEMVAQLLKAEGIDVNVRDPRGITALMAASQNDHQAVVEQLLQAEGLDVNAKEDDQNCTALMFASYSGYHEVVAQLLKANEIDVNCATKSGNTAYHFAWARNYQSIMLMLLTHGKCDVNQIIEDETPLMLACRDGQVDLVKACLNHPKIDINQRKTGGWTALMMACDAGKVTVVELLVKAKGIDVNIVNQEGWTALMLACANANLAIVKNILSLEGVDVKDRYGASALTLADGPNAEDIASLLLKYDAFSFKKWFKKIFSAFQRDR